MKFQALLISFIVIAASAAPLEVATPGNIEVQGWCLRCRWDQKEPCVGQERTVGDHHLNQYPGAHHALGETSLRAVRKKTPLRWRTPLARPKLVEARGPGRRELLEDTVSTPETSGGTRTWEKRALVEDTVFAAETGGAWIWEKRDGLELVSSKIEP
ncbi:hypothetical protein DFH09DRAFT_1097849 [Mycena vulgaris]|nr:hypothetical protein DFH09DRAFT_1097849 [Mycena vulgaris]